jgi:hypothetical protein
MNEFHIPATLCDTRLLLLLSGSLQINNQIDQSHD